MLENGGVGAAAPQIGIDEPIFVIYPNIVIRNPKLLAHSKNKDVIQEGCLSHPDIVVDVPRYKWIKVRFNTAAGEEIITTLEGTVAHIFQHELDHLNSISILDYLPH